MVVCREQSLGGVNAGQGFSGIARRFTCMKEI